MASLAGRWWQPEHHRSARFGTLHLDDETESPSTLVLHGQLATTMFANYPVIFGRTALGEDITIVDSMRIRVHQPWHWLRGRGSEETINCSTVLRGAHIKQPHEAVWTTVSCRFHHLDAWASRVALVEQGGYTEAPDGTHSEQLTINTSPPLTVSLPNGSLTIHSGTEESTGVRSFTARQRASLSFESNAPLTLAGVEEAFISPMRYFLAFATTASTPIISQAVAGPIVDRMGSRQMPRQIDVLRRWNGSRSEEPDEWEMLLSLASTPNIEAVLASWFAIFQDRKSALDLLFSVTFGGRLFAETRFLLLAQAAEVYHRHRFPGGALDPALHRARVRDVVASAPTEHSEWLKSRLQHGNEPTLASRLQALVDYSGLAGRGVLRGSFVRTATDTRNYHTHYDPRMKRKAAAGASLHWLGEELRAVVHACLLKDLGFDNESSWERLRVTTNLRTLMQVRERPDASSW